MCSVNIWAMAQCYCVSSDGGVVVNIAEFIRRNLHHAPAHAGTPAPSTRGTESFAQMMLNRQVGVRPTQSAGKDSSAVTTATHGQAASCASEAATYGHFIGRSTGSGQCVALVRASNPAIGSTAHWVRGDPVRGNASLQPGTAIATFAPSGHYANSTDGSSHSAIYLGQNANGVQVLDQWTGSPAAVRTIPWSNPGGVAANTGSAFHVVNVSQTATA
jgi:hypothetical protein